MESYEPTTPSTVTIVAAFSGGGDEQTVHVIGAPAGQRCSMHPRQKAWPHAAVTVSAVSSKHESQIAEDGVLGPASSAAGRTQHASRTRSAERQKARQPGAAGERDDSM